MQSGYLLELRGITKTFGDLVANDHIDLTVRAGEVHAVLGENGAGKTTLMNTIYGMHQPDAGAIFVRGKKVSIRSPKDALSYGIGMVHQHFMLVDVLSAVDNIDLIGSEGPFTVRTPQKIRAILKDIMERYGIDLDIDTPVGRLSISMQQKAEILKLLYVGADVIIFDEPTAILPPQECDSLFAIIRALQKEGKGIIFISHKLDEVLAISDRITVLTRGRVTGEIPTAEADQKTIVRMMVGGDIRMPEGDHRDHTQAPVLLGCRDLVSADNRGVTTLNGVTLEIHAGEILGVSGVEGNGQIELAEVLAGVRKQNKGTVLAGGEAIAHRQQFIDHRIAYIPADRNMVGTVPDLPLYENWLLRDDLPPCRFGLLDYSRIKAETRKAMKEYDIRASDENERTADLSGGNLQKLIVARCISIDPTVLICAYPTRGLDIKATAFIRSELIREREKGRGILLVSSDLDELFSLADRIIVLYRGTIAGTVQPSQYDARRVGALMLGGDAHE